jgi:hypothetical protein
MEKIIECPVSVGEVFDKISILQIKKEKIINLEKLNHIEEELAWLLEKLNLLGKIGKSKFLNRLKEINLKLWVIEDQLRKKEIEKDFGEEFVEMARKVYQLNDKRFEIKSEINVIFNSKVREVKSY